MQRPRPAAVLRDRGGPSSPADGNRPQSDVRGVDRVLRGMAIRRRAAMPRAAAVATRARVRRASHRWAGERVAAADLRGGGGTRRDAGHAPHHDGQRACRGRMGEGGDTSAAASGARVIRRQRVLYRLEALGWMLCGVLLRPPPSKRAARHPATAATSAVEKVSQVYMDTVRVEEWTVSSVRSGQWTQSNLVGPELRTAQACVIFVNKLSVVDGYSDFTTRAAPGQASPARACHASRVRSSVGHHPWCRTMSQAGSLFCAMDGGRRVSFVSFR